uniref:NADH-ubiquinone oxidoreductase chain 5 n=1 Tax=Gastrocopta cristata TaxID=1128339 RepID=A0A0A6ZAG5_9EUPU|nr:NADH dehydrogenase subunit 5 [Gastrocopta cristata]AGC52852.1 NADH dehydrogenase subunit 5 [Gastrocopta cristata]
MSRLPVLLLLSCLLLMSLFFYSVFKSGETYVIELNLMTLSSVSFSTLFIFDKISLSFGAVVTLISFCVFSFANTYMSEDNFQFRFILILAMFVLSMNILIFSGSLFVLLLGWDGLGISSFALIIYYQNKTSLGAGYLTLLTNRLGDVVIIICVPFFLILGSFNIFPIMSSYETIIFILAIAALTKSAQYPFSAWLPAAMAAPTPVSALVHSSTLVTAGVYLIIRLSVNCSMSNSTASLLLFCGSVTCVLGGLSALYENDLKKIIAFSTLSQLGLMMFSLGLKLPNLALLHLYAHAMFKALLFLSAGLILISGFGSQDLRLLGATLYTIPSVVVFFNISSLCLMGIPFLSAFYSKHVIYEVVAMSETNAISFFLMLIGAILTTIYSIRTVKILSWNSISGLSVFSRLPLYTYVPLCILFFTSIISGKTFSMLDISYLTFMFTSSYYQLMLHFLMALGVMIGLFLSGEKKSHMLSSMFFLWPSSNNLTKYFWPVLKSAKMLDYGWVEPVVLLSSSLNKLGNKLHFLFLNESKYLNSMVRGVFCSLTVFFLCI